jgi:hypothetical protein
MREMRDTYIILPGETEEKKPHRRPRHKLDDVNMDLKWRMGTWSGCIWHRIGTDGGLM